MADSNDVAARVNLVTRQDLPALFAHSHSLGKSYLLLVDCCGAESVIFSAEAPHLRFLLRNATVIVKSRESCNPGLTEHLMHFFLDSHSLRRIHLIPDILRPSYYRQLLPGLCDESTVVSILSEYPDAPAEWLIFEPIPCQ